MTTEEELRAAVDAVGASVVAGCGAPELAERLGVDWKVTTQ